MGSDPVERQMDNYVHELRIGNFSRKQGDGSLASLIKKKQKNRPSAS